MRTSSGIQTEAVYIFHNMVRRLQTVYKPEYLAAIFESFGPTFRDEAFAGYKANRTETPSDLLDQIPWIRKTLEAMRIPVVEYTGFEADDVIGTCRAGQWSRALTSLSCRATKTCCNWSMRACAC